MLGILGLGLVVFVHELGHLAAARIVGVEVEAFSLGMGPKIAGFSRGGTEWRLSAFPVGGYCKMKGEDAFRKALAEKASEIPRDRGTFYGAKAWQRIIVAIAGPLFNVLFAILVFIVVMAVGYSVPTASNRIVLASEYSASGLSMPLNYPADDAGLKTGDRIVSINGVPTVDFSDVQEKISLNAETPLTLGVDREGRVLKLTVTPALDRETGAGRIGVYSWIDTIVDVVDEGSAAAVAGILPGDRIAAVDGVTVEHEAALRARLESKPEKTAFLVDRGGIPFEAHLVLSWDDSSTANLGLGFATQTKTIKSSGLGAAVSAGLAETWETFVASIRGLGSLFRGVDLFKAVSGPARITYMIGQSATQGYANRATGGIALPFSFLAILSIGLFIMNLLPIPALDGGIIVIALVETLRRKPLKPLTVYRYQLVGSIMILGIFVFATIGDFMFFSAR
jgi:regulator of sigma E protease